MQYNINLFFKPLHNSKTIRYIRLKMYFWNFKYLFKLSTNLISFKTIKNNTNYLNSEYIISNPRHIHLGCIDQPL